MVDLILVPVLGKVLLNRRPLRKNHSVIPICPRNGSAEIGRLELLSSYYASCGCTENVFSTKNKCVSCQEIRWCSRFLSRKMMRFLFPKTENCPPKLSIRGRFSSVLVRQRQEDEFFPLDFDQNKRLQCPNEWRGNQEIRPGTRICVLEPEGEGRLEFEVFNKETNRMTVYIAPFGQDLPERRIRILQSGLREKGISLAESYLHATHIVVSRFVKDLNRLALHLESSKVDLQRHFDEQKVKCLLPQWISHLSDDNAFQYHWIGYSKRVETWGQGGDLPPSNNPLRNTTRNPCRNAFLVRQLLRLSKAYEKASLFEEEQWKALQFHKLAGRLQCLDFEINQDNFTKTLSALRKVPGIGNSAIAIIEDILVSGSSRRAEFLENDPARVAMSRLQGIHGIGRVQALRLYQKGYHTIQSLRSAVQSGEVELTREQLIGLDCFEDLQEEMARDEVESIGNLVIDAFHNISDTPAEATIMGSFRRGKPSSGDVDVLITMKDYPDSVPGYALPDLIEKLCQQGHVAHHITQIRGFPSHDKPSIDSPPPRKKQRRQSSKTSKLCKTYMGVFFSPKFPEKRRRVDIKIYPYNQHAFASLYFTGGKWFNRSMRLWATQKFNWKLSDKGLFDISSGRTLLSGATSEEEIFSKLRLRYKAPSERLFFDDVEPM